MALVTLSHLLPCFASACCSALPPVSFPPHVDLLARLHCQNCISSPRTLRLPSTIDACLLASTIDAVGQLYKRAAASAAVARSERARHWLVTGREAREGRLLEGKQMAQRAWRETRRHRGRSGATWSKKAGARQSGQLQQEGGYAAALRGSSRAEQILLGFWAWSVCQMRQSYGAGPHAGRAGPCMLRACDRRVHCGGRVEKSRGSCPNREQGRSKAGSSETVNRACRQKGRDKVEKISVHATQMPWLVTT